MVKDSIKRALRPFATAYRRLNGFGLLQQQAVTLESLAARLDAIEVNTSIFRSRFAESQHDQPEDNAQSPLNLLHQKIDALSQHLSAIYLLHEKVDYLTRQMRSGDRTESMIAGEIDRLDGYINYHLSQLRRGNNLDENAARHARD